MIGQTEARLKVDGQKDERKDRHPDPDLELGEGSQDQLQLAHVAVHSQLDRDRARKAHVDLRAITGSAALGMLPRPSPGRDGPCVPQDQGT